MNSSQIIKIPLSDVIKFILMIWIVITNIVLTFEYLEDWFYRTENFERLNPFLGLIIIINIELDILCFRILDNIIK